MGSIRCLTLNDGSWGNYSSKHTMTFNHFHALVSSVSVIFVWTLSLVVLLQAASARHTLHSINSGSGMKQRNLFLLVSLASHQHLTCIYTRRTSMYHISSIQPCETRRTFPSFAYCRLLSPFTVLLRALSWILAASDRPIMTPYKRCKLPILHIW